MFFSDKKNKSIAVPIEPKKSKGMPSVIALDTHVLGHLISDGLIDFSGSMEGDITCHTLVVRGGALINGDVKAEHVQISGRINGVVRAYSVAVMAGGYIQGTVLHEHITVEEGATIDGNMKKVTKPDDAEGGSAAKISARDGELSDESNHRLLEHIQLISAN